jgi:hypothetical protein
VTVAFPITGPDDLDERGKLHFRSNISFRQQLRTGTWMRYTRHFTTGAHFFRLHRWPDSTLVDQQIAAGMDALVGLHSRTRLLPHETPIYVISVDFDGFGNAWCYVLAGGQLGFVPGGSLVTVEERKRQGPLGL